VEPTRKKQLRQEKQLPWYESQSIDAVLEYTAHVTLSKALEKCSSTRIVGWFNFKFWLLSIEGLSSFCDQV
jgi:hypothetical protein